LFAGVKFAKLQMSGAPVSLARNSAAASGFVPAARSAAISRDFVQKRFERRSVIATNDNYT